MPMDTSMPIGVRPVQQTKGTTETTQVVRRDGSAPFTPQTNVNLQNAVNDMAGVLAKISANQGEAVEAMPEQIKEMVENVLRQAFSLETTIGEGLGSTLESQRFSVDQLTVLARMLGQLAATVEKNGAAELPPELQNFMKCLRNFVSENGSALEPVLLHKTAFQLISTKSTEELSPELQAMLLPAGQDATTMGNIEHGDSFAFLKQLVKCFLPTPAAEGEPGAKNEPGSKAEGFFSQKEESAAGQSQNKAGSLRGNNTLNQSAAENGQAENAGRKLPEFARQNAETSAENPAYNKNDTAPGKQAELPADSRTELKDSPLSGQAKGRQDGNQSATESALLTSEGLKNAKAALEQLQNLRHQITANKEAGNELQNNVQGRVLSEPIENTPQTMETMKDLAGLLLKDAELTGEEASLLQKFINGEQTVLSEKDARQLQLLLRLCESNVPASVRQAAQRNKMPDLPKLWAFMELCDLASLKEQTPHSLRNASRHVADFATAMRGQMNGEGTSNVQGERSLNFMMPLYLGDNEKSFPAYIHVYDEEKQPEGAVKKTKETWLRICLLTENIGAVELTCRIYEKQKLDVRVFFSQAEAVQGFKEYLPEFRASFSESPLQLADLKIGMVGG